MFNLLFVSLLSADIEPLTLTQWAQSVSFIGVVQLSETRYTDVRGIPQSGDAWLTVLVRYKGSERAGDTVVVRADDERGCFYPVDPGRADRYLVFLDSGADGRLRGASPWCQIPVFVGPDHRYLIAAPLPLMTIDPPIPMLPLVTDDPAATIDTDSISIADRARLESLYPLAIQPDGDLRYTQAIELAAFGERLRALLR